jgi:hypothetical protein
VELVITGPVPISGKHFSVEELRSAIFSMLDQKRN